MAGVEWGSDTKKEVAGGGGGGGKKGVSWEKKVGGEGGRRGGGEWGAMMLISMNKDWFSKWRTLVERSGGVGVVEQYKYLRYV